MVTAQSLVDSSEPETGIPTPPGVQLEHPRAGGVRVRVTIAAGDRVLLALPRALLALGIVTLLVEAWRHRVFIGFWFFGLSFLPWLFGPAQRSLLIGERELEIEGTSRFSSPVRVPRSSIARIEVGRGAPFQLFRRALTVYTADGQRTRLLVGLSQEQAEFLAAGLCRWLAGED